MSEILNRGQTYIYNKCPLNDTKWILYIKIELLKLCEVII